MSIFHRISAVFISLLFIANATAATRQIISDDFSAAALNTGVWTFVNPLGDGSYQMTGTQLALTVPATRHATAPSNDSVRVTQAIQNANFTFEVKFESAVSAPSGNSVAQGVIVQNSATRFLKFCFESNIDSTMLSVVDVNGARQTSKMLKNISSTPTQPLYLRVQRSSDKWTVAHSTNGATWVKDITFRLAYTVNLVGPFVANDGPTPPAFTALVDYFFNTASPITPEDGRTLTVLATGSGSIIRIPSQAKYPLGTSVTLNAQPSAYWGFDHWSRDISGAVNPAVIDMDVDLTVEAVFTRVIGNISVNLQPDSAVVTWITTKPTTSRVDYGKTTAYELGAVTNTALETNHSATLNNLDPTTTYHYRITSTDENGNAARSADLTFTTGAATLYSLAINVTGEGSVTRNPDLAKYAQGTTVSLAATPAAGWKFDGWSGALTGKANPAIITMTGDKTVDALFQPFTISIDSVRVLSNGVEIAWTTNIPSTGRIDFGLTTGYELGSLAATNLALQHTATLTGLNVSETHHFRIVAVDQDGNQSTSPDQTFAKQVTGSFLSDDFSGAALDTAVWSFLNPLGDGTCTMNGSQLLISVPEGTSHNIWTTGIDAPRVMQNATNGDFGAEVKFESLPTRGNQMQGILVQQDATHALRFEFVSDGTSLYAFAVDINSTVATTRIQNIIPAANPMWMHLTRSGDDWLMEYSDNGTTWTAAGLFTKPFTMTAIGPYASNYQGPAFTGVIDYFFNDARPVEPEDGGHLTITGNVSGQGTIQRTPLQAIYNDGDTVQLLAIAEPGWRFTGWTGDTTGTLNPATVTLTKDWVVGAQFEEFIINPHISVSQTQAVVTWTTPVPATSGVNFGPTSEYGGGAIYDGALVTSHTVTIPNLTDQTLYHCRISSADASARSTSGPDTTFTTHATPNIVSDDFFGSMKPAWRFVDPLGDSTMTLTGTQVAITAPAGAHELWVDAPNAPRLEQSVSNTDFEIEARFESPLLKAYDEQGIMIQESTDRFLRLEFYHDGVNTHLLVASFINGTGANLADRVIPTTMPQVMRVKRVGDTFTLSYQTNGSAMTEAATFTEYMVVTAVGPYCGNFGGAHTAIIDYFFNNDSPVTPEDNGMYSLTLNVTGNGRVSKNPDKAVYSDGEVVELTAIPNDAGTQFAGWGEALSGTQNPAQITIHGNTNVAASFVTGYSVFDIWQGDTQQFGHIGKPQVWIDILGTVKDIDGVTSLTYTLNGGAEKKLSIGPDGYRLDGAGDFNVQLAYADLAPGANTIVLRAVDSLNNVTTRTVTVNYVDGTIFNPTQDVVWRNGAQVQDSAQIVDGRWISTYFGATNHTIGYDRLIAFGDMGWTDYEITVPITVHSLSPGSYPGVGFIVRWNGHTNDPAVTTQPLGGWFPFGNCVWYNWDAEGGHSGSIATGNLHDTTGAVLKYDTTYIYKVRIQTVAGVGTRYSKKVWKQGDPEPATWTKQAYGTNSVAHGSVLFIANHMQMTVGNFTVRPVQ